jgi:hypothetical protein
MECSRIAEILEISPYEGGRGVAMNFEIMKSDGVFVSPGPEAVDEFTSACAHSTLKASLEVSLEDAEHQVGLRVGVEPARGHREAVDELGFQPANSALGSSYQGESK